MSTMLTTFDWRTAAACADLTDPEVMFPLGEGTGTPAAVAAEAVAKRVCLRCPVARDCLDAALAAPEQAGVWGGLTTAERNALP